MAEKEHVNLVTIGHIDHGKSTLVGRLLFDTGAIREETLRKLKEEAKENAETKEKAPTVNSNGGEEISTRSAGEKDNDNNIINKEG